MGSIRRRGETYRAEVYRKGVRDSATFPTRQEAADWMVRREAELLDGAVPVSRRTLAQAIDHWLAIRPHSRSDKARLAAIRRLAWASEPIGALRPETIAAWRDERAKAVSGATIRRELTALRSVLEVARRELQWITTNPTKDVRRPPKPLSRTRIITDAERDFVVAALGFDGATVESIAHETAAAFLLALETAMRAGEILAIAPADVDYRARVVTLHRSKTGPGRVVPLSKRAAELLRIVSGKQLLRVRQHREGRLFHVDNDSLDMTFRRARMAAGLSGLTFHDTRRTALTRLAKRFDVLELARISGHSNVSQLLTYYAPDVGTFASRMDD
jgi:integrase